MKKLFLASFFLTGCLLGRTQSVGIGTTTPHVNSILELNSTTKGMLMPRMTSVQRAAIISPALGLLVFDTDTKTIWTYDGSSWKNLYTSGGLSLPYSQTVNTAISAFQITNQGMGAALDGATSNEFGTGIYARSTGAFGWSLNSFSSRPGAVSVRSVADSGIVYYGENVYTGNTNTLMYLLNRGLGKTVQVQLTNNSSTSPNMQIAGNNLGEQLKIYQTNVSNSLPAVSIDNSGTGEGLYSVANNGIGVSGTSTSSYGVKGVTNTSTGFAGVHGTNNGTAGSGVVGVSNAVNTQGVYGTSTNGIGVRGFSNNYRGIQGVSTSGTGVYANSASGLALEVVGNVKISGGGTNPSSGAVLTSDASGNAVWKSNKVAFKAVSVPTPYHVIPSESEWKLLFETELYDYANNFDPYVGGTPTLTSSTFIAPVSGLYHFDAIVDFEAAAFNDIEDSHLILRKQQGNTITDLIRSHGTIMYHWSLVDHSHHVISVDVKLQAGDKLWLSFYHNSDLSDEGHLQQQPDNSTAQFSGHLVFAD